MAAASSSTAAHVLPQHKYDVFLSFRGEDTRNKFISHLYAALKEKKVLTYLDDKSLERGDELGPAFLKAIEQSKLSIITFSKNYASSAWCLDELVHILKCKESHGQLVLPVFYDVDPSHVRWQEGAYADAFAIVEKNFRDNMDKVHTWREALTRAANLSGFHSQAQNIRNENELVETIVEDILTKLMNGKLSYSVKGLVGMEKHIQQLELLLCIPAQDVCFRTVGIWGMGGCGKTTLADVVLHLNSSEFDACVFLANVREQSEKHGLYHLRNELLRQLLKEEHLSIGSPSIGPSYIIDRLSRTKVLAVLDDVSDSSQLEFLLGDQVQFGPGSRIIMTTRDRRVLKKMVHEDHIYKVNLLSNREALQLFQSIAFEDDSSIQGYSNLSEEVVEYAGCNPLALKVLASSFLHCKTKRVWEEELEKFKRFPNKEIQNVLRLSYNGLEDNEKGIFLDIACFHKGENISDAIRALETHGFSPLSGIDILIDRSLISIVHNRVEMHDLLQEMGKAIEGGIEERGKRKRLWNTDDSYQVLLNKSGTSSVEAMYLDMTKIRELQLSPTAFMDMQNLKLLKFYVPQQVHEECNKRQRTVKEKLLSSFSWLPIVKAFQCFLAKSLRLLDSFDKVCNYDYEVFKKYCKLHFPGGLEFLPEGLRYLYWDGYPWKSLPSKYFPENLVEIHMPHSQVKQLWNNAQEEGKDGSVRDQKSMNGLQFQSFRSSSPAMGGNDTGSPRSSSNFFKHSSVDSLFNMSCHNLTRCGTRSASHTPSRSHKKKTRKRCPASPETSSSSGRKSSNDSAGTTPISRSTPISKSGPLLKSESRKSTTIMFSNSSGMLKPPAIEKQLECTLEELCFGCSKKMKVTRVVVKDTGQMAQEEELVTINVKPGWKKGTKITFEGLGNERPGAYPSDIIFVIAEKRHPLFVREGDDLELTVEISLIQALTGCTISIPLLGGENTTLTVEDIIYPGYETTIPDQGMPIAKGEGKRGNLKVMFLVEFPTSLTQEQRSDVLTILEDS